MNQSGKVAAVLLVIVLLGGAAGGGYIAGLYKESKKQTQKTASSTPNPITKAADLRLLLNNIFTEHVDLTTAQLRAGYDGSDTFQPTTQALDENSRTLSNALGDHIGQDARTEIYEAWAEQSRQFLAYTTAVKKSDQNAANEASKELDSGSKKLVGILSSSDVSLPDEELETLLDEHVANIKNIIDEYDTGDNAGSIKIQSLARAHASKIADTLAEAIVKHSPDKFTET